jgi:hypothetical protein
MGLELSLSRLKALARYAFGMGFPQVRLLLTLALLIMHINYQGVLFCEPTFDALFLKVLLSTLAFTAFELPPNNAIGTQILQFLFNSRPDLVRYIFSKMKSISLFHS